MVVRQAKEYSKKLQARFAYSTNGRRIYQIDMQTGAEGYVDRYPTPDELWEKTFAAPNEWRDRFSSVPFPEKSGSWSIRYYQQNAVENALEAVAAGRKRILLTLAEIGIGVDVVAPLRCCGEPELNRRFKIVENVAPFALVICAATMTLIDDNDIEKVLRILAEVRRRLAIITGTAHECLENREEDAGVLRNVAPPRNFVRPNSDHRLFLKGRERGEIVIGLIGQVVAVGQKQYARPPSWFATEVPACLKQ
jgi:hypothetical protein